MRDDPAILILAAGASSRMRGRDKLLEEIDGAPLVLRAARAACAVSGEVLIALPAGDRSRSAWLTDLPLTRLRVAERAMSASISAGAAAARADALLIHLADMPEIGAAALESLCDAWRAGNGSILRATTADGQPGHPVIFGRELFPRLRALSGDEGARDLLRSAKVETCILPGQAAITDLDTPEDWAAWRARTGG